MSPGTAPQEQLSRLREYLQRDPENWNLRADVFDAALAAGDRDTARAQLDHAAKERPADPAWAHRSAVFLLAAGRWADARALLEALVAQGQRDPAVRYNLGWALLGEGKFEAARDVFAALLDGADETAQLAWEQWLRCEHRLYRLDEALQAFRARAQRQGATGEAWGVASLIAIDGSGVGEARAWSEQALRANPAQVEALVARGSVALAEQDAGAAAALFQRALDVKPEDGRSWSGLAFARMLARDLPGALDAFAKAVAAMPEHIGTWIGKGWSHALSQDPVAARAAFEEALRLDRNFGESHGALAVALVQLGEVERARDEIELALRLDPISLSAHYARALITGEARDPAAIQQLAQKLLRQRVAAERSSKSSDRRS